MIRPKQRVIIYQKGLAKKSYVMWPSEPGACPNCKGIRQAPGGVMRKHSMYREETIQCPYTGNVAPVNKPNKTTFRKSEEYTLALEAIRDWNT